MRVYVKLSFTVSILVCKSLNGKTCQYSNNTFQKRQKSFSFAKLNSQTCKVPHRPDAIRQRDANFQFSKTNKTYNGYRMLLFCPTTMGRLFIVSLFCVTEGFTGVVVVFACTTCGILLVSITESHIL